MHTWDKNADRTKVKTNTRPMNQNLDGRYLDSLFKNTVEAKKVSIQMD